MSEKWGGELETEGRIAYVQGTVGGVKHESKPIS